MPTNTGFNRRSFLKGAGMTAVAGAIASTTATTAAAADEGMPYIVDGKYDFDTPYSRIGSTSVKWDSQIAKYGNKVKIGMGLDGPGRSRTVG